MEEFGLDPMARDHNGLLPIHMAILAEKKSTAQELVYKHDVPIDCTDYKSQTPLHLACLNGCSNSVRFLLLELNSNSSLHLSISLPRVYYEAAKI